MEPIDYRQALLRRWRLIAVLALLGAIVGVAVPLHIPRPVPHTEYQTSTLVGVTPGGGPPTLSEIDFFAANLQVIAPAAKAVGIRGSAARLQKDVTVSSGGKKKKSASPNGTLTIAVKQATAKRAAKLTNAFAQSLGNFIQTRLNNQYKDQLQTAQGNVCSLETEVNNIDSQIAEQVAPNSSSSNSSTTPSPSYCSGSSASSTAFSATTPGSAPAIEVASSSSTTTTTAPSGGGARANPSLADLEAQSQALTTQYVAAVQKVQSLTDSGAPQSGYIILQPAQSSQFKAIPGGVSILDHHSVRGGIGLLAGAALAAGIAILLAGLDKRLRTAGRAQEMFGLTVIAEIPAPSGFRTFRSRSCRPMQAPPSVPVVSAPSSAQAEAYRMLRMALELGPRAVGVPAEKRSEVLSEVTNGNGMPVQAVHATVSRGASSAASAPPLWVSEPAPTAPAVRWPSGVSGGTPRPSEKGRRHPVVLVVSPSGEPTRTLVTANLAATYAEAGLRVQIVTTEDLRTEGSISPAGLFHRPEHLTLDEVDANSTSTQVPGVRRVGLSELLDSPGQLSSFAPELVAICRQMADVVLLDAPYLLTNFDAEALVPVADSMLVVAEAGMTTVDHGRQTGDLLRRIKAPVIGVVLTNVAPKSSELRAARVRRRTEARRRRAYQRSSQPTARARRPKPRQPKARQPKARKVETATESGPRRHLLPRRNRS